MTLRPPSDIVHNIPARPICPDCNTFLQRAYQDEHEVYFICHCCKGGITLAQQDIHLPPIPSPDQDYTNYTPHFLS